VANCGSEVGGVIVRRFRCAGGHNGIAFDRFHFGVIPNYYRLMATSFKIKICCFISNRYHQALSDKGKPRYGERIA
jgi:hypothetical protein